MNLLVSHEPGSPAPVVYDTNPTYPSLFGYLERRARFGALLTDFTRIRAGSLHRASGGVLVVRAADLLTDPIIWERMKRVLREQRIGAEDPLGPLGLYATSLRPVPVPHPRARRARRARRSSTRRCSRPTPTSRRSFA